MNIKKSIVLRVRIAFLLICLFSMAVLLKLAKVQVLEGTHWRQMAQANLLHFKKVKATRGNIFSDNGSLLATSLPFYKVAIDPTIADADVYRQGIDSLAMLLSKYFRDKSASEYKRKIHNSRVTDKHYLILNRQMINYQVKKSMSEWPIFREGRLKGGAIFERVDKRFRPFSYLALRTIGYTNEDGNGAGLEYTFNKQLAGRDGEALFRKMAGGSWKPMHDNLEVRPMPGIDIQTTLDINIQDVAESSLLRHLTEHDADYGCVVLMEVKTGEVKAMANLGKLSQGVYAENYNYAVGNQGLTDPGSTFKLASMIALLEETSIELTDSIDTGQGAFEFYDRVLHDSKPGGYGKLTVQEVFEHSSNIGVAKMVNEHFGLDPQKFLDYIDRFGFSRPIGFQMQGEAKPYVKKHTDKSWSGITLPWMSMGHEIKVSPLHMLTFYNAVANDGKMITPIIVKEAMKADNILVKYESKALNEKICSDQTLLEVRKMLEGVVERGTAQNISNAHYKIAGKTGTAQKIKNGLYIRSYYTSFVGYFPADRPKYSCIVVIDNPQGYKQYGSNVAAPVFKEIADKIYARDLDIHMAPATPEPFVASGLPVIKSGLYDDLKFICNELGLSNHAETEGEEWVTAKPLNNSVEWQPKKMVRDLVPDVTGLKLKDALYLLENKGLRVRFVGAGRVMQQSILPGTKAVKGNAILIRLS